MRNSRTDAVVAAIAIAAWAAQVSAQTPPLTVQQAVSEAIDHNLSLIAERYNVTVAQAAVVTAGLRPNPVVTVNAMLPDGDLVESGIATREGVLRTDYVLERGGKRERRVEQATLAKSVAELQLLDTTRRLVLDVETAFADVQLAKLNLALARENLATFNNVVSINVERVRTGDLAQVELARSRLAALQFQNDVEQQTVKLEIARNRLAVLLGRKSGEAIDVAGELRRDAAAVDHDAVKARALEQRPDLRAARSDQARSTADLRLQLANAKIDYTISGEYHREHGGGLDGNAYGVFFSAPLPIFNRNQGEVARADVQRTQLEAKTRALESDVVADLDAAFAEYTSARQIVERIERDMLAQARDVRSTMEYSYRRGEASLVEFLDAVRAFNDTTRSYNEARADYARSLYTLDALSGKVTP
ncbi:MAG TPA: TolC family protein [Vicinamibacterales bacterium]|nr:TolC family protein [Vicinamibacterales bacterium]